MRELSRSKTHPRDTTPRKHYRNNRHMHVVTLHSAEHSNRRQYVAADSIHTHHRHTQHNINFKTALKRHKTTEELPAHANRPTLRRVRCAARQTSHTLTHTHTHFQQKTHTLSTPLHTIEKHENRAQKRRCAVVHTRKKRNTDMRPCQRMGVRPVK